MDDKKPAEAIVRYLTEKKLISSPENMYDGFDEYRDYIYQNYDHGNFYSSIHPEDERLLYAISAITGPQNAFVAGSYYGYFAIWAMKNIAERGGMCILSDINRRVCELAKSNFDRLGFKDHSKVYCEEAEKLMAERGEPIDLLLLDAVGNWNDPRPEYRGKQIYVPILRAASPFLSKGSVIVIHNMRPNYFDRLISLLKSINALGICYNSYNGLGVYVIT